MRLIILLLTIITIAVPVAAGDFIIAGTKGTQLAAARVATFDEPWAMTFLPGGTLLVTEKRGVLWHVTSGGSKTKVQGLWKVAYGGQGGLGDVVLHPDFERNSWVYLSYAERAHDNATIGAVVVRAKLDLKDSPLKLAAVEKLWVQEPKVTGKGHYSHRIAFGPGGKMFITSGDRQKLTPAQNFDGHLGKVLRLNDDGTVPNDNPWQNRGGIARQFWTVGHRNMLGIDFDADGRLWVHEMGPRHGDELNLILAGKNMAGRSYRTATTIRVYRSPIMTPVLNSRPPGRFGCPPLHRPVLLFMTVPCLPVGKAMRLSVDLYQEPLFMWI